MNNAIKMLNTNITGTRAQLRRATVHAKPVAENIGIIERDSIPIEVAESMLFTPGTKLTGAMRRNCLAARETVFVSIREGKEFTSKLKVRAKHASAAQLLKWARRVVKNRAKVTRDYLTLAAKKAGLDPMKLHDIAKANRVLAIMDIKAANLDAEMASYRSEAETRLLKANIFEPVR